MILYQLTCRLSLILDYPLYSIVDIRRSLVGKDLYRVSKKLHLMTFVFESKRKKCIKKGKTKGKKRRKEREEERERARRREKRREKESVKERKEGTKWERR